MREHENYAKKQMKEFPSERMKIELLKGDLSKTRADVLVNAAGTTLGMGGGVAGALKRAGGKEIEIEALKHAPAKLSEVIVTGAGKLKAKYVFHAAAQPHYGNFRATEESVRKATRDSLEKAEELGCKSIAFPALGCGIAGLEIEKGARAILGAIREFEGKAKNLKLVKLVLLSQKDFEAFEREFIGRIPSEKECYQLLKENRVPENVLRHSERVKEFALELAAKLRESNEKVNPELVLAGALLHDIDKIETLKGSSYHGDEGCKKLKAKGYYAVAGIVRKHLLERVSELDSIEEKIVYYADKRVIDDRIVSLKERLEFIKQKYGSRNKELMKKIMESEPLIIALEKELMGRIKK